MDVGASLLAKRAWFVLPKADIVDVRAQATFGRLTRKQDTMKILVIGASQGTGKETVRTLLVAGHDVTAFARSADRMDEAPRLTRRRGDVLSPGDVARAVEGHDAVIVTLGITESPVAVRLGLQRTPLDVRSRGTANVIAAMQRHGVRRLIVQSTYGVGQSAGRLSASWALVFRVLLWPQILDTNEQESLVRSSGLSWTIVQPVGLSDAASEVPAFTSTCAEVRSMAVTRAQVARAMCGMLDGPSTHGACVAISS
jgi:uncharacterized protein YbjT (DUF2867 family)